jgi:hypothetical protein
LYRICRVLQSGPACDLPLGHCSQWVDRSFGHFWVLYVVHSDAHEWLSLSIYRTDAGHQSCRAKERSSEAEGNGATSLCLPCLGSGYDVDATIVYVAACDWIQQVLIVDPHASKRQTQAQAHGLLTRTAEAQASIPPSPSQTLTATNFIQHSRSSRRPS